MPNNAKKYPWWRQGAWFFTGGAVPPVFTLLDVRNVQFPANLNNGQPLRNDSSKVIDVHEIRLFCGSNLGYWGNIFEGISFRIKTNREIITNKFLPGPTYNTEPNRMIDGIPYGFTFKLPTPYLLKNSQVFQVELLPYANGLIGQNQPPFNVTLRGKDPVNGTPMVLSKYVFLQNVLFASNIMSFDDARDQQLRDMLIEDITVSVSVRTTLLDQLVIRFKPPEGPLWTTDPVTPAYALSEYRGVSQMPTTTTWRYFPSAYFKPVVPFRLYPGDTVSIEGKFEQMNLTDRDTELAYALLLGTQEEAE